MSTESKPFIIRPLIRRHPRVPSVLPFDEAQARINQAIDRIVDNPEVLGDKDLHSDTDTSEKQNPQ